MKPKVLALVFLFLPSFLSAQEFRGSFSGTVTDAGGSNVPNAQIAATETNTGTKSSTVSNSGGQYTLPFLSPGTYTITAELPGFKRYSRDKVQLGAGDHQVNDIHLEIGDVATTVNVTAEAPQLNTENASVGQAITTQEVADLPLNGRTPLVLASLSIGVLATGQPSLIHPFDSAAAAGWSIGGTPSQVNEILINGSPDATWDGRLAYSPPADAVEEVRTKAFDTDAAFGHTGGGTINQVLKSGGNSLHGSLSEFNQPNTLSANNFFNNQKGLKNSVTHYNQYTITAGGPVWIPKVFNGRNKLFWFFAYEGLPDSQPNSTPLTVPTDDEKKGDFSALLKLGTKYQLYNPFSGTLTGTTVNRTPIAGNIIPANLLSSINANYLKYLPSPNVSGQADGTNNFLSTAPTPDDYKNALGRLDYNLSDRDHMFFDVRHTDYSQTKNNYYNNLTTGSVLTRSNIGTSFDNVFTVNATNVIDLRFNFTRMDEAHPSPSAGFDPSSLGFPSYFNANSQYPQLPTATFATATGLTTMGFGTNGNKLPSQSAQIYGTWSTIKGAHSLRFGVDLRQYNLNVANYGNSSGTFAYSANNWVRASSSASTTVVQGQDFAEFMMGTPTGGSYDINTSAAFYEHYYGVFAQDDWRIKRNLTINLGLRFDHDAPYYEKYGRTINGFDFNATNPLSAAATAAYSANPVSQLPVSAFQVRGGPTYPSDGALYHQNSHLFSPRIGFAWLPDLLKGKTVIRGGFAMFVQPFNISQLTITGAYSTNPILEQQGFSQTTSLPSNNTNNNGLSPAVTLGNPFPNGLTQPAGSSAGLATFVGQNIVFLNPQVKDPYSVRWNFGFEHAITPTITLEAAYIGNHSVHTPAYVTQFNNVPVQFLSTMTTRDQPLISTLTGTVKNPFAGLQPTGTLNGSTISLAQLLSRYPEYPQGSASGTSGIVMENNSIGSSYFQSLNVRLSKRFSSGLLLVANYIHSRLIERLTFLNDTDLQPEKRLSPYDHPDRFVLAFVYELPFGRGKRFNVQSRWLDMLVGGWGLNSIYTYQVGAPVTFVNGSTTSSGDYPLANGTGNLDMSTLNFDNRSGNLSASGASIPSFDTSAFKTASTDQFQFHIRTFPTTFSAIRLDGINEWSPSLSKKFTLMNERVFAQLRLEAYNVLNHPVFGPPNTTVTNAAFGVINTQANRPRTLQLGARITF